MSAVAPPRHARRAGTTATRRKDEPGCASLPVGVNSNVRLASRPVPLTFARAAGAYMWDVDGNEYVDYAGGMGPMVLGRNHPRVLDAVRNALEIGQAVAGRQPLGYVQCRHALGRCRRRDVADPD